MKSLREHRGVALITVLFFLVIITIMATGTILITTTQVNVAGSIARLEMSFEAAEGGINYSIPLMMSVYYDGIVLNTYKDTLMKDEVSFEDEFAAPEAIFGEDYADTLYPLPDSDRLPGPDASSPKGRPEIVFFINGNQVEVDIDYLGFRGGEVGSDIFAIGYYSQGSAQKKSDRVAFFIHARASTPKTKYEIRQTVGLSIK